MIGKVHLTTLAVALAGVGTAHADVFVEFGGIAAPEPTVVGGRDMTPYDVQCPIYPFGTPTLVSFAPSDLMPSHETVFSPLLQHLNVGAGWATWPGAYGVASGSVYSTGGGTSVVLTFPTTPTKGFYFYVEPGPFALHSFTVTATDDSGAVSSIIGVANGQAGAALFTVWTMGSCITSITIDSNDGVDFAIGQFGYNACEGSGEPREPNPQGPGTVCGTCCQAQPPITRFTRPTALATDYQLEGIPGPGSIGTPGKVVLHAYEIGAPPIPPAVWASVPRFEPPNWTLGTLGTVFGVTTDASGNIYLAHSDIFWSNEIGSVASTAGAGTGAVIAINGNSGVPSLLVDLPNSSIGDVGLGNLTWSCDHDCLYVTNFEDGRIYRIEPNMPTGTPVIKSAWDFATDTITMGGAPEPTDPPGIAPYGERVWAVAYGGNRLFFSVWSSFTGGLNPGSGGVGANTIWSVELNANGDPVPQTKALEIVVAGPGIFNNPIADLAFDGECCLYAAQRTMIDMTTDAHASDLLKYCWSIDPDGTGSWQPGGTFIIGGPTYPRSATGGVGVDLGVNGLVWASGDALTYSLANYTYGIEGLPTSGGTWVNGVFIDNDNDVVFGSDKTLQGSVEVICELESPCLNVSNQKIFCPVEKEGGRGGVASSGCYTWTFTVTNKSVDSVKYVTVPLHPPGMPHITINPNVINLLLQDGSLLDTGESTSVSVEICGAQPGDVFSLELSLVTPDFEVCCFDEITPPEMPACDCGQLRNQEIEDVSCLLTPGGMIVGFDYCFTLDNLSGHTKDQVIFIPADPRQAYFGKDFHFLPPLDPGESIDMCVSIQNAVPGEEFCFFVLLQHPGEDCCCAFEKCITVPDCTSPVERTIDLNHDHIIDGSDLAVVLGQWGECPGCQADLNGDAVVDGSDLAMLLGAWGPCP